MSYIGFKAAPPCLVLESYQEIKGHLPSADLRYGDEDSISPNTLIFASKKG